jgi:hypothetical protein
LSKIFGGKLIILLFCINLSIHADGVRCKTLSSIVATPADGKTRQQTPGKRYVCVDEDILLSISTVLHRFE